jgi:hypothetical protein
MRKVLPASAMTRDSTATNSSDQPQRASLDTLALTSDLTSYPLRFESERR